MDQNKDKTFHTNTPYGIIWYYMLFGDTPSTNISSKQKHTNLINIIKQPSLGASGFLGQHRGTALQHVRTTTVVLVPSVGQWPWSCTTPFHCANTRPGRVGCFWGVEDFEMPHFLGQLRVFVGQFFLVGFLQVHQQPWWIKGVPCRLFEFWNVDLRTANNVDLVTSTGTTWKNASLQLWQCK